ncbi:hypothetical protein C4D60_Mb06t09870 [Musa balbisiana]|uniref:UspA domain-containing protein n=1 Tax=Musa balbisiana TaxID=52838 RepID=A0A4V4H3T1_MUSBA|nr:hypothetical protein C4D60_Mb06t09870 [Musa balbisiana]
MDELAVEAFQIAMLAEPNHLSSLKVAVEYESDPYTFLLINMTHPIYIRRNVSQQSKGTRECIQVRSQGRIVEGEAGKMICREAERLKPAALVMGTRGRGRIQRAASASTASVIVKQHRSSSFRGKVGSNALYTNCLFHYTIIDSLEIKEGKKKSGEESPLLHKPAIGLSSDGAPQGIKLPCRTCFR